MNYSTGSGTTPFCLTLHDFNNDGLLDIATTNYGTKTVGVLLGQVGGGYAPVVTYATQSAAHPFGIAAGDITGDGRPDLVVANSISGATTGTVSVLPGQAGGTFGTATLVNVGGNPVTIALGDVTGDGRLDIVTSLSNGSGSSVVSVVPGLGSGTFGTPYVYGDSYGSRTGYGVALGDLNGDGRLDIAVTNLDSGSGTTVEVLLNQGGNVFSAPTAYATGSGSTQPTGIAIGDINNDGRPDLATTNYGTNTVGVLLGQAGGTFGAATTYATVNAGPRALALGDVNVDGLLDIVTANFNGSSASVLLGLSGGGFGAASPYTIGANSAPWDVALGDLDGNGSLDIAVTGRSNNAIGVLLNTLTAPTSVVSINRAGSSPTNASTVNYTVTFAAPVTGPTTANFGLATTGSVAGASVASVSGSGTTYTVSVNTGTGDGTVGLNLTNAAGLSPSLNNTLPFMGQVYTLDKTAPTVAISSTAGAPGSQTSTSPLAFTVIFSESVTGFAQGDLTVTNGTVTGFTGSGTTYTFNVTPTTAGTATTVNVPANVAVDTAGNGNTGATSAYSLTYQPTAVTWNGSVSSDWFTAGNWTPAVVPTTAVDATIPGAPSGGRFPAIASGTANARNLALNSGATLNHSGGTLTLTANLTNNGNYIATGTSTTMSLGTTTLASILGSSNTRFYNLTIGVSGAQSSTSASTSVQRLLTLNGNLATNGNPLTLLSSASGDALVYNNGGVVTGAATVQRYIDPSLNPGLGYRHYSAPVSNTTVADLTTSGFTPVVNPTYNTSPTPTLERPFPTVYGYDQSRLSLTNSSALFDKGFFSPNALSDPLVVGQGYTVNIGASELVDFMGTLNNGSLTLNLASNRSTYNNDGGWQLLGNPYPSPLDYSLVATTDRQGLDAAIYVFGSTAQYQGQYRSYVNGIGGNPVLPSGQGFFTRVSSGQASGSLTFRNSQRLTSPNGTTFQRTTETRPLVKLTLKGTSGTATDDAYVYFQNGATDGFDAQYDAVKLPNTSGLNLSTSITGQQLAIDGRAELGTSQRVVPLAVGVPASGTYTFTAAQLLNLTNVPVYLRDLQSGAVIDLAQQSTYQFTVTNATTLITGRFELVFSPQQALATVSAALAQQVALYPNPATKQAFVELPVSLGRQAVTATLLDAVGREARTVVLPAQGAAPHQLDLTELPTGIYMLRLSTSAGVVVKKLVVE
ncbi:FG-GAP-like repeat-containing protein [Hymenobacter sp. BRD67]|uniref:FG-GAP-like repeat-containing protein n=1 Tax=Hymenobacter sp. BRD67 TaxID=2675877 RepID=UPI001566F6D9|nr:FG-GAP-like repeat-containing protein [Hymenobacter sp. BRD67]QKG54242.1 VCBS repeat-containing protein [Hymenobacter sp. BRD67]